MQTTGIGMEIALLGIGLFSLVGIGVVIGTLLSGHHSTPPFFLPPPPTLGGHDTLRAQRLGSEMDQRKRKQGAPLTPRDGLNHEDTATTSRSTLQRGLQNMIEADLVNQIGQPATMEEIVLAQMTSANNKNLTPQEVFDQLKLGNARFWMGASNRPELGAMERRALIIAQAPKVCVLGCSDSRVPVEIVFDQGLGDMFVIRCAGNVADTVNTASIEYAVQHLMVKLLVVMGHEGCGAVKSACLSREMIAKEPDNLKNLLLNIKSHLDEDRLNTIQSPKARDREAVISNTVDQLKRLSQNPVIKAKVDVNELMLVGAFYEITSGIVDFHVRTEKGLLEMVV